MSLFKPLSPSSRLDPMFQGESTQSGDMWDYLWILYRRYKILSIPPKKQNPGFPGWTKHFLIYFLILPVGPMPTALWTGGGNHGNACDNFFSIATFTRLFFKLPLVFAKERTEIPRQPAHLSPPRRKHHHIHSEFVKPRSCRAVVSRLFINRQFFSTPNRRHIRSSFMSSIIRYSK